MDKVFREPSSSDLHHYKLRELKAMFGFKPMINGSPVMISSDGTEPMSPRKARVLPSSLLQWKRIHNNL